ncbi:T9SS type A sorting domain-containing protein [Flavobacterium pallidum]|uniref:Secretion system C-terminal sorting domain-containing protein n=1 Tax=Flavobacterium pallidum TaxID=2172098 RepID=A0A2S1SH18_9FLAO|nr:T9SS type A sorting domain-containing protein [Flavobacterium pallidum]AWI25642.1 hypothetical protein HYN49_06880 [Flavobacterium pallidum]
MMKKYLLSIALVAISAKAFSQDAPLVHANVDSPYGVCDPEACITLTASLENIKETTGYDVNQITYQNLYPYDGGTVIPPVDDDVFGPAFPLGFNFCFYGNTYSSVYIGTNGVISFNAPATGNFCPWQFNTAIPDAAFPIRNAIYGVYQDTYILPSGDGINGSYTIDTNTQNVNYYTGGTAPNRYLVVNFNKLPQYSCGIANLQTSQIVLHESSNIIDVYVKSRVSCDNWNQGNGLIGIQNAEGTLASVPTNRNTGAWSITNEAWRFLPNGNDLSATAFQWSKNGVVIDSAIENSLTVCEDVPGTYDVTITYTDCAGIAGSVTATSSIQDDSVVLEALAEPVDLSICTDVETAIFDLSSNTAIILGAVDPMNYEVNYYNSYQDALDWNNSNISNSALASYMGTDGEEIYVRISDITGPGCAVVKSFTLEIEPFTVTPEGDTEQDFEAGDTLEDLEVDGENVSWWDAPQAGNELPATTPLVDGTTYYAESENENGCPNTENRMAAERLAVTVTQIALGTPEWTGSKFSVAPNPVKDILSVNAPQSIYSLEVYNLIGQRVLNASPNTPQAQINLSSLAAGTYLMKVGAGNRVKTVKIVKE